jgi:hypothetical protein
MIIDKVKYLIRSISERWKIRAINSKDKLGGSVLPGSKEEEDFETEKEALETRNTNTKLYKIRVFAWRCRSLEQGQALK